MECVTLTNKSYAVGIEIFIGHGYGYRTNAHPQDIDFDSHVSTFFFNFSTPHTRRLDIHPIYTCVDSVVNFVLWRGAFRSNFTAESEDIYIQGICRFERHRSVDHFFFVFHNNQFIRLSGRIHNYSKYIHSYIFIRTAWDA